MTSIHDLFKQVQEHPDFRFGTIFVAADIDDGGYANDWGDADKKWAEEHLVAAGFEYLNNVAGSLG